MNLAVNPVNFTNNVKASDKNPITRKGEVANLTKATFFAGVGLGTKLLFELLDDEFLIEHASDAASKMVDKKNITNVYKRALCKIGGTLGLLVAGVATFGLIYTAYKSYNIAYESKINTFTKKNDMDVFIKKSQAQSGIYEQLNKEVQKRDSDKEELKKQYSTMQISENKE